MSNENMIKALRCLGSNSPEGDCYMDFFNFNNQNEILNDKIKPMTCGNRTNDPKYQQCPYHQDEFETCFEDGECDWLKDTAELIEQLQVENEQLKKRLENVIELPFQVDEKIYVLLQTNSKEFEIVESYIINYRINRGRIIASYYINCPWIGNSLETEIEEFKKIAFKSREDAIKAIGKLK